MEDGYTCPHCNEPFAFKAQVPNQSDPNVIEYVHLRGNSPHLQGRVCPPRYLGQPVPADDYSWNPNFDPKEFAPLTQREIDALGVEELFDICLCDTPETCPRCQAEREGTDAQRTDLPTPNSR